MFHIGLRMATDLGQEQAKTHIYCLLANSAMEQGMVGQAERLFTEWRQNRQSRLRPSQKEVEQFLWLM